MHSLAGLRAGLSQKEIDNLVELDKACFSQKKWLALRWARDWAVLRGKDPKGKNAEAFEAAYTKKQRAYIKKLCAMMKMANYTSNFLFAIPYREDLLAPGEKYPGALGFLSGPVEGLLSDAVLLARGRAAQSLGRAADACAHALKINRCAA